MKYWKSTNMITNLKKLDVNVLEIALTHLIEELTDTNEDLKEIGLDEQLASAKAMYLALGNKSFWGENK
tara:strand:+ start:400 stop:606 length:207 start_codon:yes stop_codon:yes gene_type:complete